MSTKLFALTSLLALASAYPAFNEKRTDRSDCWQSHPGTVFYNCANGNVGCFYQDPCSLEIVPAAPAPPSSSSVRPEPTTDNGPAAAPAVRPEPTTDTPSTSEVKEQYLPRSYNIYVKTKTKTEDEPGHTDLNKPKDSDPTTHNVILFDKVPAGAKNCQLNWRLDKPADVNEYRVEGSGKAWHRQLTGFPAEGSVNYDGIIPFQDASAQWKQSMTFKKPGDMEKHAGPMLKCGTQVAVEIKGDDSGTIEQRVFMVHSKTAGFYLSYEL